MKVVEALQPHGLTLQNFASIREQTMGGFTQVGSHGSGATIPPVDEQVVSMKLVTPAKGCLELSQVISCPALLLLPRPVHETALTAVHNASLVCVCACMVFALTLQSPLWMSMWTA